MPVLYASDLGKCGQLNTSARAAKIFALREVFCVLADGNSFRHQPIASPVLNSGFPAFFRFT